MQHQAHSFSGAAVLVYMDEQGPPWGSDGEDLAFQHGGEASIPGWGAMIPRALRPKNQNIE